MSQGRPHPCFYTLPIYKSKYATQIQQTRRFYSDTELFSLAWYSLVDPFRRIYRHPRQ